VVQDRQSPDPARDEDERRARGLLDVLQRELAGEETVVAGRYVLSDRIGAGAHGTVHTAVDRLTGERVAVKLLPPAVDLDLVRLRGEIAALRLLRLPGVVHLFDEGVDHGRPFLVMERVDGVPFPGVLPEGATSWSWEALRGPTLALLDTLARVHAAGLVHRDLKPRNVLVTAAGRPMLLDFGLTVGRALAEDSASDTSALGTPAYAAPEQVRGEPVDARADLYSLGVMLWEALAGRRPHEGPRVSGILRARLAGPVESLERVASGVPREVAEVVDQMLEIDRECRPR
jgi:serine/threonine protein kinase